MKNIFRLAAFIAIALAAASCGGDKRAKNFNQQTQVDDNGLAFMMQAAESGLTEIKASTLAKKLSKNPRVVNFAAMMIDDHTKVADELKKLAKRKLVTLVDTIGKDHQMKIDSIAKLMDGDFDKAYMQMMVKDHETAVQVFHQGSLNNTTALKNFAEKNLPKLQMHLDSAKAISASLK